MAGPRTWRHESHAHGGGFAAAILFAIVATGCKSGTWGAKPSWWSFGGSTPATSLAAAPEFNKDVTKPSEAAKPYPTTETPEAYALAGGGNQAAASPTAPGGPTMESMSVTYGSTPPPAEAQPGALAQTPAEAAGPATTQPDAIGPQVGPYASLQPAAPSAPVDPAAAVTAGLAAAPAFGEASPPAAASRVADARSSESWTASPPAAGTDPRYGATNGSRFSSDFQPAAIEPPPAAVPYAPPAAAIPAPPAATAIPPTAAPPAAPPATPIDPAATPIDPAGATASPPGAPAAALPGSVAPPRRRPDPGYRPGGTSSYRPSRSILAEDETATGGVMPVSFEAKVPGQ